MDLHAAGGHTHPGRSGLPPTGDSARPPDNSKTARPEAPNFWALFKPSATNFLASLQSSEIDPDALLAWLSSYRQTLHTLLPDEAPDLAMPGASSSQSLDHAHAQLERTIAAEHLVTAHCRGAEPGQVRYYARGYEIASTRLQLLAEAETPTQLETSLARAEHEELDAIASTMLGALARHWKVGQLPEYDRLLAKNSPRDGMGEIDWPAALAGHQALEVFSLARYLASSYEKDAAGCPTGALQPTPHSVPELIAAAIVRCKLVAALPHLLACVREDQFDAASPLVEAGYALIDAQYDLGVATVENTKPRFGWELPQVSLAHQSGYAKTYGFLGFDRSWNERLPDEAFFAALADYAFQSQLRLERAMRPGVREAFRQTTSIFAATPGEVLRPFHRLAERMSRFGLFSAPESGTYDIARRREHFLTGSGLHDVEAMRANAAPVMAANIS